MKLTDDEIGQVIEQFVRGGRMSKYRDGGDREEAEAAAVKELYRQFGDVMSTAEAADAEGKAYSLDDLGAKMFALNVKGTSTRYPNDPLEDLPGEIGHTAYAGYEYKLADQFQAVKSLRCFLYQCAEGDVPQDELYKALADLLHEWALEIVSRLPDYERAEWD